MYVTVSWTTTVLEYHSMDFDLDNNPDLTSEQKLALLASIEGPNEIDDIVLDLVTAEEDGGGDTLEDDHVDSRFVTKIEVVS